MPALLRQLRRILSTCLIGGLLGATLIRLGPGFGIDQRALDARLSEDSRAALRARKPASIPVFYMQYLAGLARGDPGYSTALGQPIAALLRQRLPVTLASLAFGVLGGGAAGLVLALAAVSIRFRAFDWLSSAAGGLALSLPAAVIALFFLWMNAAGRWAIAIAVFPHVFRYSKNILAALARSPHVFAARARGVPGGRVLVAHILVPAAPQLAALAGVSVSVAFGASIPIEVVCDVSGIGQLAWQAALARDLPLLVTITMLVALLTTAANGLAETALRGGGNRS